MRSSNPIFPTSELGWAPGKRLLEEVTDEEPASDGCPLPEFCEDGAWWPADDEAAAAAARMMDVDASFGGLGVP